MKVTSDQAAKPSKYLAAGSPQACFLPSCYKPFELSCVRGEDNHFYCSQPCAEIGAKLDMTHVEELKLKAASMPTPKQKLTRTG